MITHTYRRKNIEVWDVDWSVTHRNTTIFFYIYSLKSLQNDKAVLFLFYCIHPSSRCFLYFYIIHSVSKKTSHSSSERKDWWVVRYRLKKKKKHESERGTGTKNCFFFLLVVGMCWSALRASLEGHCREPTSLICLICCTANITYRIDSVFKVKKIYILITVLFSHMLLKKSHLSGRSTKTFTVGEQRKIIFLHDDWTLLYLYR